MTDITIPPEAITALRGLTCCGCDKCLATAIRAALSAWPGMASLTFNTRGAVVIVLPMTQEARDENHLRPDRRTNVAERLFGDE